MKDFLFSDDQMDVSKNADNDIVLKSTVEVDESVQYVLDKFDLQSDGNIETVIKRIKAPSLFGVGLIVGPSGSGKSTLLKEFGKEEAITWDNAKAVVSHFDNPKEGTEKLMSVGFNSVPSWLKPFHVLSTGEKYRCLLARQLKSNAVIDEFTSVVDRNVAKSMSKGVRKSCDKDGLRNVVICSCHYDIIDWLQPDWIYDTLTETLTLRGSLRQFPKLEIRIYEDKSKWKIFAKHHYLDGAINKASFQFVAYLGNDPVGFISYLPLPSGTLKNAWREHRLVVMPDYQGLGLGKALTEWVGDKLRSEGKRFYSKTTHPKLGEYRNRSDKWRNTGKNGKIRTNNTGGSMNQKTRNIKCYSHEYVFGDYLFTEDGVPCDLFCECKKCKDRK